MTTTEKRPAMTATEAKSFNRVSLANMVAVRRALKCGCQPYRDVFTFWRWKAQGFSVRKGEKSIHIPVVINTPESEDADTGEIKHGARLLWTGHVFCRCQVAATEVK